MFGPVNEFHPPPTAQNPGEYIESIRLEKLCSMRAALNSYARSYISADWKLFPEQTLSAVQQQAMLEVLDVQIALLANRRSTQPNLNVDEAPIVAVFLYDNSQLYDEIDLLNNFYQHIASRPLSDVAMDPPCEHCCAIKRK